jgi:hypothetical protein
MESAAAMVAVLAPGEMMVAYDTAAYAAMLAAECCEAWREGRHSMPVLQAWVPVTVTTAYWAVTSPLACYPRIQVAWAAGH